MTTDKVNGTTAPQTIETDVALLQSLLASVDVSEGAENLTELLARLDDANGVANTLEAGQCYRKSGLFTCCVGGQGS